MIPDKYPIIIVDELLDKLFGDTVFFKIDLKPEYHHISVYPTDVHKTAFQMHEEHCEFLVMPFRLLNGPSTFQAIMKNILSPHLRKFILVFFNNILIYSKTIVGCVQPLCSVM